MDTVSFAEARRDAATLIEVNTGHEVTDMLTIIWPRNFFSVNFTKLLASEAVKLPFQVDVHLARHPLFVAFGEQGGHEAQARSGVWED